MTRQAVSKRERAQRQREEILRRQQRRRRNRWIGVTLAVLVLGGVAGGIVLATSGKEAPEPRLPGLLTTPAPWPANAEEAQARVNEIGLPPFSNAAGSLHIHPNLGISIHGQPVAVPANVGISQTSRYIASLHTHDESGAIHVESSVHRAFTLGEFFDVWGVRFDADCIGSYCTTGNDRLEVFADGERVQGDPRALQLEDGQEILVAFGTPEEIPSG